MNKTKVHLDKSLPTQIVISLYLRPTEGVAELLTGLPDGGRVDDGHELLDVLAEELVEEALVAVQEVDHVHVLVQLVLETVHCENERNCFFNEYLAYLRKKSLSFDLHFLIPASYHIICIL